jgi:hypothetical protein
VQFAIIGGIGVSQANPVFEIKTSIWTWITVSLHFDCSDKDKTQSCIVV